MIRIVIFTVCRSKNCPKCRLAAPKNSLIKLYLDQDESDEETGAVNNDVNDNNDQQQINEALIAEMIKANEALLIEERKKHQFTKEVTDIWRDRANIMRHTAEQLVGQKIEKLQTLSEGLKVLLGESAAKLICFFLIMTVILFRPFEFICFAVLIFIVTQRHFTVLRIILVVIFISAIFFLKYKFFIDLQSMREYVEAWQRSRIEIQKAKEKPIISRACRIFSTIFERVYQYTCDQQKKKTGCRCFHKKSNK